MSVVKLDIDGVVAKVVSSERPTVEKSDEPQASAKVDGTVAESAVELVAYWAHQSVEKTDPV